MFCRCSLICFDCPGPNTSLWRVIWVLLKSLPSNKLRTENVHVTTRGTLGNQLRYVEDLQVLPLVQANSSKIHGNDVLSQLPGLTFSQVSEISVTAPVKAFLNPENNPKGLGWVRIKGRPCRSKLSFSAAKSIFQNRSTKVIQAETVVGTPISVNRKI